MANRLFCQDHPGALALEAQVLAARPGAVLLDASPFFPGGGGPLADRGGIAWNDGTGAVTGFQAEGADLWHALDTDEEIHGIVHLEIDRSFRHEMCQLHTLAHIASALVFDAFDGALPTGAQLGDNGTLRVDIDPPGADNAASKVLKVEKKGRHNRRLRLAVEGR